MNKLPFHISLLSLFLLLSSTNIFAGTMVNFAFEDKESFPYYMGRGLKPRMNLPGASVEVVQLVCDKLNIKINWIRMPWKRCLNTLGINKIDGTFNASYKQEREKLGVYPSKDGNVDKSRRLVTVHYAFYKLLGSDVNWDGKTLNNFTGTVGAVNGYSVEKDLIAKGIPVDPAPDTLANLNKLLFRRVNLIAGAKLQIDSFIKTKPDQYQNIIEIETPLKIKASYLILSHQFVKNNRETAKKIWDTIKEVRESEEYIKIFDKYYNKR